MNNDSNSRTAVVFIPLTQGKVTVIDFDDFEKVREFKWHVTVRKKRGYAARNSGHSEGKRRLILLHRELVEGAITVDHIDGDGLNNRRYNLRAASYQQNNFAFRRKSSGCSSVFRGVTWDRRLRKWKAAFQLNRAYNHVGLFMSEVEAAKAYDSAVKKAFGEFAACNFPERLI